MRRSHSWFRNAKTLMYNSHWLKITEPWTMMMSVGVGAVEEGVVAEHQHDDERETDQHQEPTMSGIFSAAGCICTRSWIRDRYGSVSGAVFKVG